MEQTEPAGESVYIHAVKMTAVPSLVPVVETTEPPSSTEAAASESEETAQSPEASQPLESEPRKEGPQKEEPPLGLVFEKGKWYYYAKPGVRFKGWLETEEGYSYFDEARVTGFYTIDGDDYYFPRGIMATGLISFRGVEIHFDEISGKRLWDYEVKAESEPDSGSMVNHGVVDGMLYQQGQLLKGGYVQLDGQWYLTDDNGRILTGKQLVGDQWHYFRANGTQAYGFIETAGDCYYADEDGYLQSGFVLIGGVLRYFDPDSLAMVRNTVVGSYQVDGSGRCTKKAVEVTDANLDAYLDSILAEIGRTPRAIYDYVCQNYVYVVMGWDTNRNMAIHMLNTGYGACIHFCAVTEMLLNRCGYATHWVRGELGHYWLLVEMSPGVWRHMDTMRKNHHVYNLTDAQMIAKRNNPYGVNFNWDETKWTSTTSTGLGDGTPVVPETTEAVTTPEAETTQMPETTEAPEETTTAPETDPVPTTESAAPIATTVAPEPETTAWQEETTAWQEETTAWQEETTVWHEETTAWQEETTAWQAETAAQDISTEASEP